MKHDNPLNGISLKMTTWKVSVIDDKLSECGRVGARKPDGANPSVYSLVSDNGCCYESGDKIFRLSEVSAVVPNLKGDQVPGVTNDSSDTLLVVFCRNSNSYNVWLSLNPKLVRRMK